MKVIPNFPKSLTHNPDSVVKYPKAFGLYIMEARLNDVTFQIMNGDITTLDVNAIVVSTPPRLELAGGDIGKRILHRGGPTIMDELDALRYAEPGEAVLTGAGTLPAQWIIHVSSPRMGSGGERGKLASGVWNAMRLAVSKQMRSVAFTPLATGSFGYPVEGCASVMAQKIVDFTFEELDGLSSIIICLDDPATQPIFESAFNKHINIAFNEAGIT